MPAPKMSKFHSPKPLNVMSCTARRLCRCEKGMDFETGRLPGIIWVDPMLSHEFSKVENFSWLQRERDVTMGGSQTDVM